MNKKTEKKLMQSHVEFLLKAVVNKSKQIDELMIDESISYLCGIKDAQSLENGYWIVLPDVMKYESLKLSNPKYDIPLKELKRISGYM